MTNWIFYLSLPSAPHNKTGTNEKSWAKAWINSHECHRRSKYCINISAELHMLDVERCLLLSDEALRTPDESHTSIGYDGDWKELSHDYNPFTMDREKVWNVSWMEVHRSVGVITSAQLQGLPLIVHTSTHDTRLVLSTTRYCSVNKQFLEVFFSFR